MPRSADPPKLVLALQTMPKDARGAKFCDMASLKQVYLDETEDDGPS